MSSPAHSQASQPLLSPGRAAVFTVTLNPAIDRTLTVPGFAAGEVNRVLASSDKAGGKGVNVAIALALAGTAVTATGLLGSQNRTLFTDTFGRLGITDAFTTLDGQTRTALKVVDPHNQQTTDINFPGLRPDAQALEAVKTRLLEAVKTQVQSQTTAKGQVPHKVKPQVQLSAAAGEQVAHEAKIQAQPPVAAGEQFAQGSSKSQAEGSSKPEAADSSKPEAEGDVNPEAAGSNKSQAKGAGSSKSQAKAAGSSKPEGDVNPEAAGSNKPQAEVTDSSKPEVTDSSKAEGADSSKAEGADSSKAEALCGDTVSPQGAALDSPPTPWVALCGSLPPGVDATLYATWITVLKASGAQVLLDTSGDAFSHGIAAAPTLIKPNQDELEALLGRPLTDAAAIVHAARELIAKHGIRLVAVSMGADGACLVSAQAAVRVLPVQLSVHSTAGAGDAMVAGILYAQNATFPASGASAASTFSSAPTDTSISTAAQNTQVDAPDHPAPTDEAAALARIASHGTAFSLAMLQQPAPAQSDVFCERVAYWLSHIQVESIKPCDQTAHCGG